MARIDEVFTHVGDDGTEFSIMTGALGIACKSNNLPTHLINIDPDFVATFRERRGIEQFRLDRIDLRTPLEPILMAEWEGGTFNLIDGHHRTLKAHEAGWTCIEAYLIPVTIWSQFLIDLPKRGMDIVNSYSGFR